MTFDSDINTTPGDIGKWIYGQILDLYPICRSITGDGVRDTLRNLKRHIDLEIVEIPSGTKVFDWNVPSEWNIKDAWIKDPNGKKVVDFKNSNLHVMSYSIPVHRIITLKELRSHLFSIPEHPDWIPYRTSYYRENWGFCLTQNQLDGLQDNEYEVFIDSTLNENGSLTYGEYLVKGESDNEILFSAHACHPSMCNDNLSGVCTALALARWLNQQKKMEYSYRFIFAPGTIGAITWLAGNKEQARKIKCGLILTGLGDPGQVTFKRSRQGAALIDRAMENILLHHTDQYGIEEFTPYGYDERQYCSPGFNLAIGRLSRSPFGTYPEYHTSADNAEFVHPDFLLDSYDKLRRLVHLLERNRICVNLSPYGEPQLGKRGLFNSIGDDEMSLLWVLNLSDGENDLLSIAEKASIPFERVENAATRLESCGLLSKKDDTFT